MLVLLLSAVGAVASPAETSSFTLGSGTGSPGNSVRLPIYLNLSRDQQFERIVALVDHPPTLSFRQPEVDKDAQASGVTIEVKESAPPAGSKTKRVEVTLKSSKGKPLPTGMIGWLSFAIDGKAQAQMASLPVTDVKGFSMSSGALLVKLRGDSGGVTVYEAGMEPLPSLACFFFTH